MNFVFATIIAATGFRRESAPDTEGELRCELGHSVRRVRASDLPIDVGAEECFECPGGDLGAATIKWFGPPPEVRP